MLVELITTWTAVGNGAFGGTATGTGIAFDTTTHQVVPFYGSKTLALLDPVPPNAHLSAGAFLWFECDPNFTETQWYFDGINDVYTATVPNSGSCGWTPPPPPAPVCALQLTLAVVGGDTLVATTTGAYGAVRFSLDSGSTTQASNTFGPLVAGTYTVTAYDGGVSGCQASAQRTLTAGVPWILPTATQLPAVGFSRNPLSFVAQATQPGRALLMELWVETAHGTAHFERQVQRVRPTDAARQTLVQVQEQLHSLLTPERPDIQQPLGLHQLTSPIRRYYATVAEVQPATGRPGPLVKLPTATVLRGGLGWAPARAGTFFSPLPADWLSWRPATEHVVGPTHVALLAALVPAGNLSCTLRVRCYDRGAATPTHTLTYVLGLAVAVAPGAVDTPALVQAQVPAGGLPAGTYRFDVTLLVGGSAQTSACRFRLDTGRTRRQYIFLNSLGQWDTLSCAGPLTSKGSVERTVATRLMAPDYDPQDGPDAVVAVTLDTKLSVSTGLLSPGELEYLRELLLSTDVYEVAGPQLRKIRLTTKDFLDYQDNAGADGLAFEYTYCFDTTYYDNARLTHL
ncbi:MAG: hypothetical protein ACRYFX_04660 [Janthinobacterium lividum]